MATDIVHKCGDLYFHDACFVCHDCKKKFAQDNDAYNVKGLPYCSLCEIKASQEHCAACGGVLEGKVMKLKRQLYHPDCLVCANPACGKKLTTQYRERGGKLYCVPCSSEVKP